MHFFLWLLMPVNFEHKLRTNDVFMMQGKISINCIETFLINTRKWYCFQTRNSFPQTCMCFSVFEPINFHMYLEKFSMHLWISMQKRSMVYITEFIIFFLFRCIRWSMRVYCFNPLLPCAAYMRRSAKILILI